MPDLENKDLWDGLLDSYREHLIQQGRSRIYVITYLNPVRKLISFAEEKGVNKGDGSIFF